MVVNGLMDRSLCISNTAQLKAPRGGPHGFFRWDVFTSADVFSSRIHLVRADSIIYAQTASTLKAEQCHPRLPLETVQSAGHIGCMIKWNGAY